MVKHELIYELKAFAGVFIFPENEFPVWKKQPEFPLCGHFETITWSVSSQHWIW